MSTRIITIPADESQPSTATTPKADIPTPAECPHERPYWFSGEPGVHIPLNGEAALRCLDCGEYGYLD